MEIFPPPLELFLVVSVLVPFFFGVVPPLFLIGAPLLLLLFEGEGAALFCLPPLQLTPLNYRVLVIHEILDLGARSEIFLWDLGLDSRLGLGLNSRSRPRL